MKLRELVCKGVESGGGGRVNRVKHKKRINDERYLAFSVN